VTWFEAKQAAEAAGRAAASKRFAETLLGKEAALSPLTRLSLGLPVAMTDAEEAALDRASVRPSTMDQEEPAPPPEPAPEPVPEAPTEPMEVPFEPREEPTPVERPAPLPPPALEAEDRAEEVEEDDWAAPSAEISAEPPTRGEVGRLFNTTDVPPLVYREVLAEKYKGDWMEWEPETLWWQVRKDFGPVNEIARNKIMALRACLKTNTPWIDWDAFENVANAFNDNIPIFGLVQPPELEEAAYAVMMLRELEDWPFGSEVSGYLAAVCLSAGLIYAPEEWFPSAQYFIDRQSHNPALVEEARRAWEALRGRALTTIEWREDNALDNQVRKLWEISRYIESRSTSPMSILKAS
jgi:hypothetical protein